MDPDQSKIVDLSEEGNLSINSIADSSLLGLHDVKILAYLIDLDPSGRFSQILELKLQIEVVTTEESQVILRNTAP